MFVALAVITLAQNQNAPQYYSCLCSPTFIRGDIQKWQPNVCEKVNHIDFSDGSAPKCLKMYISSQAFVCVFTSAHLLQGKISVLALFFLSIPRKSFKFLGHSVKVTAEHSGSKSN